jgi:3-oxoacyl-[acyl-carrier protein] reductase
MRRALITGGSAGIGLAICRALLDAECHVVSLDRQPSPIEHARHRAITVDLSDEAATQQAAQDATREPVTTMVHNAGMIRPALLQHASVADLAAL